jgi:cytochrome P450
MTRASVPLLFDPLDPALIDDPYPTYARLRDEAPVAYLPAHDVWAVTRYDDVAQIVRDPATFSSKVGMSPDFASHAGTGVDYRIGAPKVRVLIATDPPEHQVFRQAVAGAFAPSAIAAARDRVVELARGRVLALLRNNERGEADLFADLAEPLPVLVLADLLGVPAQMHDEFRAWSTVITADLDQSDGAVDRIGRGIGMFRYFSQQLRQRRPSSRYNLFDGIAKARESGVSEQEVLAFCAFLLVAGIETTTNLLTNMFHALLRYPLAQQRLRENPHLMPTATEEALRYDTSVQALWRGTTRAVQLRGNTIPADSRVLVVFGSANRDERKFPDADSFLIDRSPNEHLGFGGGPHFCLGTRLARLEIAAAVGELLAETAGIEAAGPGERTRSVVLRGFTRMPVRLTPR